MKPRFGPLSNFVLRGGILGVAIGIPIALWQLHAFWNSRYVTKVGIAEPQPVPFSHQHHVSDVGIDCRHCHRTAESSAFAGMPTTELCMTCHSQLWTNAELLAPVRASWQRNAPLVWRRVHDMPDFVYFNHAMHVNHGIGCASCHGRVDQMPLIEKAEPMTMEWCLSCHRDPAPHLRPADQIYSMQWIPPDDDGELGRQLLREYDIQVEGLTDCTICHR